MSQAIRKLYVKQPATINNYYDYHYNNNYYYNNRPCKQPQYYHNCEKETEYNDYLFIYKSIN